MKEKKFTLLMLFSMLFFIAWNANAQFFEINPSDLATEEQKGQYYMDENDPLSDPSNVKLFLQQFDRGGEKIVGGEDVDIEDYPWQISLQLRPPYGTAHFCGGTIIGNEWILTASHCLFFDDVELQPFNIRIRAGFTALNSTEGSYYNISEIIVHPDYGTTSNEYQFDIALLRLSSPIDFEHPGKALVNIVTQNDVTNGLTDPGVLAKVSGWGALSFDGPSPDILQAIEVPIVGGSASYPPSLITSDMIMAGAPGQDACQGDSGGPLVVPDGMGWYKVGGVVSWGVGCGSPGYPGVYARVSYFEDWLNENLVFPDPNQYTQWFYEDFNGEIPGNWESVSIAGNKHFVWTDDTQEYAAYANTTFSSPTAENGFAMFDNLNGTNVGPNPAEVALVSPEFNFNQDHNYFLSFDFLARHLGQGFGAAFPNLIIKVEASTDDFSSDIQELWSLEFPDDAHHEISGNAEFDISSLAGQSNVNLRFRYIGGGGYWWLIDDVRILEENTPLQIQFVVTDGTVPLADAIVTTGYTGQEADTDNDGVAFLTLYEGDYTISVTKSGYFPYSADITITEDGQVVDVVMEKIPAPEIEIDVEVVEIQIPQGNMASSFMNISNPGDADLEFSLFALPAIAKNTGKTNFIETAFYPEITNPAGTSLQLQTAGTHDMEPGIKDEEEFEKVDEIVELHHDNGHNGNGIGAGASTWITAVRFDEADVAPYLGVYELAEVKYHIRQETYTSVIVKIWEGGSDQGPGTEVYSQDVTDDVIVNEWNNHILPEAITLQPDLEYWIGYQITSTGQFPSSVDDGPMVENKGAWVYLQNAWSLLPDLNAALDFNWNIRGILHILPQVEWLSFDPQVGIVLPEADQQVELIFDATGLETGSYAAQLFIQNNATETIVLPVMLEVVLPEYDVTFSIVDENGDNVVDAVVTLDGLANAAGDYLFENVLAGTYAYEVEKVGYQTATGSVLVADNMTVEVVLLSDDAVTVNLTVSIDDEFDQPVEDAYITIQGFGGHYTNAQGEVVISIIPGTFNYSVTKTGFEPLTSSVVVTEDAEQNLDITLTYLRFDVVVNINIDNAGTVTGAGEYYYGESATLEAIPDTGYHFVHWTENEIIVSTDTEYTFDVTANRELLAVFALNTYTITATAGPNGEIDPSGEVEVFHGDDLTFDIYPLPGYHIDDVLVNGESVGAINTYTFENVSEDGNTIHAEFAINVYQVTVTHEGNGTITPNGVIDAPHGSNLVFELVPDANHQVANIQVDGQSVGAHDNYILSNITANTSVHAVFEPVVSVDLIDPLAELKVYPNPATSQVTIESNEIITEIRLLNITGQLVMSRNMDDLQGTISLSGLSAGLYILQIKSESGMKAVSLKVQ